MKNKTLELPILELTSAEFDSLPKAEDQPEGWIKYAPVGYMFKCRGGTNVGNTVIGQKVNFNDAFAEQAGACFLAAPKHFVNRYEPKIV